MTGRATTLRGINYDVGTRFGTTVTFQSRVNAARLEGDFRAIAVDLHCNALQVYGTEVSRLEECALLALRYGFHVWIQPRLIDTSFEDILEHLADTARMAERIRRLSSNSLTLDVGCELTVFMSGIIPGDTYIERMARLPTSWELFPRYSEALNEYLKRALLVARTNFHGQVTCAAARWETVDWTDFDLIGLDHYLMSYNKDIYVDILRQQRAFDKPIVITEFGCCSYVGADDKGPAGYEIIDWSEPRPRIDGAYTRDERVQAEYISKLLKVFEEEKVYGYFVYTFSNPDQPFSSDPRYDLDMACFGVVKVTSFTADGTIHWEPKVAFHEIDRRQFLSA